MSTASARRILVPVGDSVTVRNTVAYAAREAADSGGDAEIHFVSPVSWQRGDRHTAEADETAELLDRIETWVHEDLDATDGALPIAVTTAVIGTDEYLFSPRDYADSLIEYAREHDLEHVILDPEYKPGARAPLLTPLGAELDLSEAVTYEEAPVERTIGGRGLLGRSIDLNTFVATFVLAFLFYQVLGGFSGTFDYATGALSAGIVAAVLSGITFERPVRPGQALQTGARWLLYIPYLFWEIAKANFQVVYIVLHPDLPIDPTMERFSPAVPLGLPVTTLANSITLTPGTVTVDAREGEFLVHALTQDARDGLYDGGLERAVRFVFFGRTAARIPSPRERGQAAPEDEPDGDDTEGGER